ncbi:Piwi-domain-containing protein [Calocera viscosa TUFC12733]|uniref:Piwi-domain-containing protein n=1 Tax=Calocera viscosa (strain TUFC12733) TaxID=1330018 RepID=A0A167I4T7_CALVF|nr:Piwi-domain-containing protein [Calocera viscosa TUFC12733]
MPPQRDNPDRGGPPRRGPSGGPGGGPRAPYSRGGPPPTSGPSRGGPRGGGPGPGRGGSPGVTGAVALSQHSAKVPVGGAAHVTTVAVRRPGYGTLGRQIPVVTNTYPLTCPPMTIYHYDVVINEDEKKLPARFNLELVERMQSSTHKAVFAASPGVYDGRKNYYTARPIPFPDGGTKGKFDVPGDGEPAAPGGPPPKIYTITLNEVARISPETLDRFAAGEMSHDEKVTTAITAMNVVIRMVPNLKYPFNIRSFFTDAEMKNVGAGLEVWRGYFQSVRWGVGRLVINVDISTGQMFQRGPLLKLCIDMMQEAVGRNREINANTLCFGRGFDERMRVLAHRQISGVKVMNRMHKGPGRSTPKLIKRVLYESARTAKFKTREGEEMTVLDYIRRTYNYTLQYPDMALVEVGSGAKLPIEMCDVLPGQVWKRQTPPNQIRGILEFSTQKPPERLRAIQNSMKILEYGQSKYLSAFNMKVTETPINVTARVLKPPELMYGNNSTIAPKDGAWNMKGKLFFRPASVENNWWVWNLDQRARMDTVVEGLVSAARETGIGRWDNNPLVRQENVHNRPQGMSVVQKLDELFQKCVSESKLRVKPFILVVVLPHGMNNELYQTVKYLGDIKWSIPTQCMQAAKAIKGNAQYFANIMLKANVKMGGVNVIPDRRSVPYLMDASNPTLVLGADSIHPTPGSEMRPTFTAVVSSVDTNVSKYYAQMRPQDSRKEIIDDLADYSKIAIDCFKQYRSKIEKLTNNPARIIYFRDGVSEGQFQEVLDTEVPAIREGCRRHGIKPLLTVIVVGKRHHVRMFPGRPQDGDRSGNCPAGTVIDTEVVHPTDFDFFLQSHGGILGTSKATHYTVLLDESEMKADDIQQLCFSLCHVYQRSTRSVSIPAPTYYADIVCSRFKNHFEPGILTSLEQGGHGTQSIMSGSSGRDKKVTGDLLGNWKQQFKMPAGSQGRAMYFM